MHTCIHVFISPTLVSQICSTDDFYGIFTIDYVKIKTSVFWGIVFSSCMFSSRYYAIFNF